MLAVVVALVSPAGLDCFRRALVHHRRSVSSQVVAGILLVGGHLDTVALRQPQPLQTIFYTIYFLIPHLEWFDIRDRIVYDWGLVDWLDCVVWPHSTPPLIPVCFCC